MAKKATASKKATKPASKPATKAAAKPAAKSAAKPMAKATAKKPVAKKTAVKKAAVLTKAVKAKPALMTKKGKADEVAVVSNEPKDQGDLLIEMAKDEMSKVNAAKIAAEKAAKVKPIKIERGNIADEKAKWQELFKRHGKDKANAYKMTDTFEALKPIQHKILGWGFVLSNENNRLEVLFENGIKMLISNYKPS